MAPAPLDRSPHGRSRYRHPSELRHAGRAWRCSGSGDDRRRKAADGSGSPGPHSDESDFRRALALETSALLVQAVETPAIDTAIGGLSGAASSTSSSASFRSGRRSEGMPLLLTGATIAGAYRSRSIIHLGRMTGDHLSVEVDIPLPTAATRRPRRFPSAPPGTDVVPGGVVGWPDSSSAPARATQTGVAAQRLLHADGSSTPTAPSYTAARWRRRKERATSRIP